MILRLLCGIAALFAGVALTGCGGSGASGDAPPATSAQGFTVGGSVTGLFGSGLTIENNAGDPMNINANSSPDTAFRFPTRVAGSAPYAVTIKTQPTQPAQVCTVSRGTGTTSGRDITDVQIQCAAPAIELQVEAGVHTATLTWSGAGAATRFAVYVSADKDCDIRMIASCESGATLTAQSTPFVVDHLVNGKPYFFKVESVYANGGRAASNEAGARPNALAFNGDIYAIATAADGTAYVGGLFTRAGITTGSGIPFDADSGHFRRADFPLVDGSVFAIIPDGNGGWYLGGSFESVAGVTRQSVAHILPDYSVDAAFVPPDLENHVLTMARIGNRLYIGGDFSIFEGTTEITALAALDAATGERVTTWTPAPNNNVAALAVSGGKLYAGGRFTTISQVARRSLAELDPVTGAASLWNPNIAGDVSALAAADGKLYVGGQFQRIGGTILRNNLAAFAPGGTNPAIPLDTWLPSANGRVNALATLGDRIFIAGEFNQLSALVDNRIVALSRNRLAAVTVGGTLLEPWAGGVTGSIRTLAVTGNSVYAGGKFDVGANPSSASRNLAAFDATTGALIPSWTPNVDEAVHALAASGNTIYAGGSFASSHGEQRGNLAAIDATGALAAWNPAVDAGVFTLAVANETVYAGGSFLRAADSSSAALVQRRGIAAFDAGSGLLNRDWNPDVVGGVNAIALSGDEVYVAGGFTSLNGGAAIRHYLGALHARTGLALPWNPNPDYQVYALAAADNVLYAGGDFSKFETPVAGQPLKVTDANALAAFDIGGNGIPRDWHPDFGPGTFLSVYSLAASAGSLYVGGSVFGVDLNDCLSAIDIASASPTAHTDCMLNYRNQSYFGYIAAVAARGTKAYGVGNFTSITDHLGNAQPRGQIARFDAPGRLSSWNPTANDAVFAIAISPDGNTVYVGGGFTGVNGTPRGHFGVLDATTGELAP